MKAWGFASPIPITTAAAPSHRRGRGVDQAQPHALATAVAVERQRPGEMGKAAFERLQALPQRLAGRAKGDRLQRSPVGGDRAKAQMIGADERHALDAMARQGEDRLGVAGAVRPRRIDRRATSPASRAAAASAASIDERFVAPGGATGACERRLEMRAQLARAARA